MHAHLSIYNIEPQVTWDQDCDKPEVRIMHDSSSILAMDLSEAIELHRQLGRAISQIGRINEHGKSNNSVRSMQNNT